MAKIKKWEFQKAKSKFSNVVRKASEEGPQTITKNGKDFVVILSAEDYRLLTQAKTSLVEFFQTPPLMDVELDLKRDKSPL